MVTWIRYLIIKLTEQDAMDLLRDLRSEVFNLKDRQDLSDKHFDGLNKELDKYKQSNDDTIKDSIHIFLKIPLQFYKD